MAKKKIKKSRLRISRRGGKKNKLLSRGILVVGAILIVLLFILLAISIDLFEPAKEEIMYPLADECSLVMGNIIHQIRDVGDCRIRCVNECGLRDLEIVRTEFELKNSSCHVCDCYCI